MPTSTRASMLAAAASGVLLAANAFAQSAAEPSASAPFVPVEHEPPPKLVVDAPLPDPLARGAVLIPYRVENFRILPVLGAGALSASPRIGHLHVTVDDLPWHWGDFAGNNLIVVVGLPAGPHKVLVELADPTHRIITAQNVTFMVPNTMSSAH